MTSEQLQCLVVPCLAKRNIIYGIVNMKHDFMKTVSESVSVSLTIVWVHHPLTARLTSLANDDTSASRLLPTGPHQPSRLEAK